MNFGIIGSGSWATALAKILTDNKNRINWWLRSDSNISSFKRIRHNPQYLSSAVFDTGLINFSTSAEEVINQSDVVILVVRPGYGRAPEPAVVAIPSRAQLRTFLENARSRPYPIPGTREAPSPYRSSSGTGVPGLLTPL